jgi:hypothetical protein
VWSDEEVLAYARAPWVKDQVSRAVLGKHHGVTLLQDVDCSDVCPDSTIRFLRYDLGGRSCEQVVVGFLN